MASRVLCVLALFLLTASLPVRAANPKISLKVQDATAAEAAAALGKAAGIPVELYAPRGIPAAAAPAPAGKASFDWSAATFGRALRQLCRQFDLMPSRRDAGYVLYPSGNAPAPANAKPVGLVEKDGIRMYATSIRVQDSRYLNFIGPNPMFGGGGLYLSVSAEMDDRDPELIAGIENASAKDDLGNLLVSEQQPRFIGGEVYNNSRYPDEWSGSLSLPMPHPKATKLLWVEGDLMAYRASKPFTVEVPLPYEGKSARKQVGDVLVVVSGYRQIPKPEDPGDEADLPGPRGGQDDQDYGPSFRTRIFAPLGARIASRTGGGYGLPPTAVGASGKTYRAANWRGWGTSSDNQMMVYNSTWVFPGMDEKPVKLVWDLVVKDEPVRLFSFHMADIPLPEPGAFLPQRVFPGRPRTEPSPERPFTERGGGILVHRVELAGKAAGEGRLQVGLSAKEGADWGPVRWTDLDVGADGAARMEDVKPGDYRLFRVYRPKTTPATSPGRWTNGELPVTVTAGKETPLPPLRWVTIPEKALSAPAGRKPPGGPALRRR